MDPKHLKEYGILLAVDPGKNAGWARFDGSKLTSCGVLRGVTVDNNLVATMRQHLAFCDEIIVELPQVYPGQRQKGDPNDLIRVAGIAGAFIGYYANDSKAQTVSPFEWKGNEPKEITEKRVLSALSAEEKRTLNKFLEKTPKSFRHNALDAVGLGLWKLGRKKGK